jgi:hypothetical protein
LTYYCLGSNHFFVYVDPCEQNIDENLPEEITWDFAQKEIAQAAGYATDTAGLTKGLAKVL